MGKARLVKKPWRLICEMLKPHSRAPSDSRWVRIEIGPRRYVRCSCGGGVEDRPHTGQYVGGGCTHIVALYTGHVTEDKRERDQAIPPFDMDGTKFFTRFTQLGKQMFYPRYTVRILSQ